MNQTNFQISEDKEIGHQSFIVLSIIGFKTLGTFIKSWLVKLAVYELPHQSTWLFIYGLVWYEMYNIFPLKFTTGLKDL